MKDHDDKYYEYIGRQVKANQEKRRQHKVKMHDTWLAEGQQIKTTRENSNVSQAEISKKIGADKSVIQRFENGLYVKRRPVIKASYKLALEVIELRRLNILAALNNG